jgi:hypothetical protein
VHFPREDRKDSRKRCRQRVTFLPIRSGGHFRPPLLSGFPFCEIFYSPRGVPSPLAPIRRADGLDLPGSSSAHRSSFRAYRKHILPPFLSYKEAAVKLSAIMFLATLLSTVAQAQPVIEWSDTLHTGETSYYRAVQQALSGGFVCAGSAIGPVGGIVASDILLRKVDSGGVEQWTQRIDWSEEDRPTRVQSMPDGGYLLCGMTGNLTQLERGFLVKTDSAGQIVWQRRYEYGISCEVEEALPESDGGFLLICSTVDRSYYFTLVVIKTDSLGVTEWTHPLNERGDWWALEAGRVSSGGYLIFASDDARHHPVLIRITDSGDTLWTRTYLSQNGRTSSGCVTSDGGSIIAGNCGEWAAPGIFVIKTDSAGQSVWSRVFGAAEGGWVFKVRELPSGGFAVGGYSHSQGEGGSDAYLIRLDEQGNLVWDATYGAATDDRCYDFLVSSNGNLFMAGSTAATEATTSDAVLYKLGADTTGCAEVTRITSDTLQELGFRLEHRSNRVGTWCITGFGSSTSARVAGMAAGNWTALPGGDGNDGDSILFVAGVPFESGSVDTFWLSMPYGCQNLVWSAGCHSGTIPVRNEGRATLLHHHQGETAYALDHVAGRVRDIVFAGTPPGSSGRLSGESAVSWSAMPGGDGNDGDSVVFSTENCLVSGRADTFWVSIPENRCNLVWESGCYRDSVSLYYGSVDSICLRLLSSDPAYPIADSLQILAWNQANLDSVEIWAYNWNHMPHCIAQFAASTGPNEHEYGLRLVLPFYDLAYFPSTLDRSGCRQDHFESVVQRPIGIDEPAVTLPLSACLASFPNPFNPSTTLSFTLPREGRARIVIYDLLGREVQTLADNVFSSGEHRMTFDGSALAAGLYFARLQSGSFVAAQKLLLLK